MHINASKAMEACEILDLDFAHVQTEAITTAFRRMSKTCHPDGGSHDPEKWGKISWAREVLDKWVLLRAQVQQTDSVSRGSCRACSGLGFIQRVQGFGKGPRMMCVMCHGSGNPKKPDREE